MNSRISSYMCREDIPLHPGDMTSVQICPRPPEADSMKHHDCGCPTDSHVDCWDCCMPGVIETRVLRRPVECVKPQCNFTVPSIPCWDPPKCKREYCNPLCFDWTVDEPGPNDSYGLNGLNWYDWKMEGKYDELTHYNKSRKPIHPGFSWNPVPQDDTIQDLVCTRPMECYSAEESTCCKPPFRTDVNYFRDWRCCQAKPPAPWKPPKQQCWATRTDL